MTNCRRSSPKQKAAHPRKGREESAGKDLRETETSWDGVKRENLIILGCRRGVCSFVDL